MHLQQQTRKHKSFAQNLMSKMVSRTWSWRREKSGISVMSTWFMMEMTESIQWSQHPSKWDQSSCPHIFVLHPKWNMMWQLNMQIAQWDPCSHTNSWMTWKPHQSFANYYQQATIPISDMSWKSTWMTRSPLPFLLCSNNFNTSAKQPSWKFTMFGLLRTKRKRIQSPTKISKKEKVSGQWKKRY